MAGSSQHAPRGGAILSVILLLAGAGVFALRVSIMKALPAGMAEPLTLGTGALLVVAGAAGLVISILKATTKGGIGPGEEPMNSVFRRQEKAHRRTGESMEERLKKLMKLDERKAAGEVTEEEYRTQRKSILEG